MPAVVVAIWICYLSITIFYEYIITIPWCGSAPRGAIWQLISMGYHGDTDPAQQTDHRHAFPTPIPE